MALPTTYSTGTATVNANETTVTGQGTTWITSGLQAGDLFWAGGMSVRIALVNSNTSLTLAFPWPGGARINASYEIRFTPDATRVLASARAVLDAIAGGNIKAIGDLVSAPDKLPYFTGAGTASLASFTAAARRILDDASEAAMRSTLDVPARDAISVVGLFGNDAGVPYLRKSDNDAVVYLQPRIPVASQWLKLFAATIQWGTAVVSPDGNGRAMVTLPTDMGTVNYFPVVTNGGGGVDIRPATDAGDQTGTQFAVIVRNSGGGAYTSPCRVNFIAIGYPV